MPEPESKESVDPPVASVVSAAPEPPKSPAKKIVLGIIFVLLIIGCGVLGYLYFTQSRASQKLAEENKSLADQLQGALNTPTPSPTLSPTPTIIPTPGADLEGQINICQAKVGKASAYNDVFTYYNSVIETHSGFTGWTEAEYQAGLRLAEKTSDTNFLNLMDAAWHGTSNPILRILAFQKALAGGIENSLK